MGTWRLQHALPQSSPFRNAVQGSIATGSTGSDHGWNCFRTRADFVAVAGSQEPRRVAEVTLGAVSGSPCRPFAL
jgi:hypothetical protein